MGPAAVREAQTLFSTERSAVSPASAAPRGLSVNAIVHHSRRELQVSYLNGVAKSARASIDGRVSNSGQKERPDELPAISGISNKL
jgi:hypothetical protein